MERLTKYQNDLIRNKAINILRRLSDKNNLSGDELSVIGAFLVLDRVENNTLKKYEDSGIEPEDIPLVKNLAIQQLKENIKDNELSIGKGRKTGIDVTPIREANETMDQLLLKLVADVRVNESMEDKIIEAIKLLKANGYVVKKWTAKMEHDATECEQMDMEGKSRDCCGCSCNVCLIN